MNADVNINVIKTVLHSTADEAEAMRVPSMCSLVFCGMERTSGKEDYDFRSLYFVHLYYWSQDSVVSIATGYG
jgi:hypothetical protein